MKLIIQVLFFLSSACTELASPPTIEQLDWNPMHINKTNCPDFSGKYIHKSDWNYLHIFPQYPKENLSINYADKNRPPIRITVKSEATGILIRAEDDNRYIEKFSEYDGRAIGCQGEMLISRYQWMGGGGEAMTCTSVTYGERRIFKNNQGDLVVVRAHRRRCARFGFLENETPTSDWVQEPIIYKNVK